MKKTITTITLALVMTFGATFANAGIIIGDRNAPADCTEVKDGIIIGDLFEFFGIIIGDIATPDPCSSARDGIIIGD